MTDLVRNWMSTYLGSLTLLFCDQDPPACWPHWLHRAQERARGTTGRVYLAEGVRLAERFHQGKAETQMRLTKDEYEHLDRADRLIAQGVKGNRSLIAAVIFDVVVTEREACARIADDIRA